MPRPRSKPRRSPQCHPPNARSTSAPARSARARAPEQGDGCDGPWRASSACSRFRFRTSCFARRRCIARTMRRPPCSSRRLISIKTGGCPEDCGYCPQAKRYHTGVADEAMLDLDTVVAAARAAQARGRDALLHGRRVARAEGSRSRAGARDGARSEGARPRDVLHARPAQGRPGRGSSSPPASTTTTTTSTPRPSSTAR